MPIGACSFSLKSFQRDVIIMSSVHICLFFETPENMGRKELMYYWACLVFFHLRFPIVVSIFFLSGFYLLVHLLSFITCDLFSIPSKGLERWHKTLVHVFILRSPFVTSTFLCEILSLNFASWQFWVLYKVIIDNCWPFWPFRTTLYPVLIVPYLRTLSKISKPKTSQTDFLNMKSIST